MQAVANVPLVIALSNYSTGHMTGSLVIPLVLFKVASPDYPSLKKFHRAKYWRSPSQYNDTTNIDATHLSALWIMSLNWE